MLTGRYFWKHPGEERIHRVESELPTIYDGQVNLVKEGAGDPKNLRKRVLVLTRQPSIQ